MSESILTPKLLPFPSVLDSAVRQAYVVQIEAYFLPIIKATKSEQKQRQDRERHIDAAASKIFKRLKQEEAGRILAEKRLRIADRHTPAGLKRIARCKYEARRETLKKHHHVEWTKEDLKARLNVFAGRCAYCQSSTTALTIDHFIPISKGGGDCLGNFVPCCAWCNRSKNASEPEVWFKAQSFYSVKRWDQILRLLGKNRKNANQLPLF